MSEQDPGAGGKSPDEKLKVEKQPLEEPEDLPVTEEDAEDVKGGIAKTGLAPPYVLPGPGL